MEGVRQSSKVDVVIAGGGPAGCAAAIALARGGKRVLLLEAGRYPRQKVCGEFVSGEALPLLRDLVGTRYGELIRNAPAITRAILHGERETVNMALPAPARSISRYALDFYLWLAAANAGTDARTGVSVTAMRCSHLGYEVETSEGKFFAEHVIDATGRWSRLNAGSKKESKGIGIKAHMRGAGIPERAVSLFFFEDGYCGVEAVAPGVANLCAMVHVGRARRIEDVLRLHPSLDRLTRDWEIERPTLTTAPLIPGCRKAKRGAVRVGDAAGFLHPFLGDGISMALRSGVMAATTIQKGRADYDERFRREFGTAFTVASIGGRVLQSPKLLRRAGWSLLSRAPVFMHWVAQQGRSALAG